jgi:hypothetical protein
MSSICLIDTSIFLELLNVPNYNQHRASVLEDFKTYSQAGCTFLLPMATILETGNHIARPPAPARGGNMATAQYEGKPRSVL